MPSHTIPGQSRRAGVPNTPDRPEKERERRRETERKRERGVKPVHYCMRLSQRFHSCASLRFLLTFCQSMPGPVSAPGPVHSIMRIALVLTLPRLPSTTSVLLLLLVVRLDFLGAENNGDDDVLAIGGADGMGTGQPSGSDLYFSYKDAQMSWKL